MKVVQYELTEETKNYKTAQLVEREILTRNRKSSKKFYTVIRPIMRANN
jgi:hypothetical protein